MQRTLDVLKAAALGAVSLLCIAGALLFLQATKTLHQVDAQSAGILGKLDATLDKVNRPCNGAGDDKADSCGTIALANQTMVNAGDLVKLSELTEKKEFALFNSTLPPMLSQTRQALENVQVATGDASNLLKQTSDDTHGLLLAATARTNDLAPLEANLSKFTVDFDASSSTAMARFTDTLGRTNTLLADPSITSTLQNVAGITATGNHMLFTADAVETKLAACTLHPTFTCRFKSNLILGAQVGGYLLH